jgi:hypothetical protein
VLHVPRAEPAGAEVRVENGYTVIKIPGLDLWTIVELL